MTSQHQIIVAGSGNVLTVVTGTLVAVVSTFVPEWLVSYAGKLAVAAPIGFLTAAGAWGFNKLVDKHRKRRRS